MSEVHPPPSVSLPQRHMPSFKFPPALVATVFTWEYRSATPFWNAVKMHTNMADEIQSFKTLIMIHKVIRDGHPAVLEEAMREVPFLDSIARNMQYNSQHGYAMLIQAYIKFLKSKLEFHTLHRGFRANMDYEEYRALKKVDDPNEGYITIMELATLLEKVDELQRTIFASFRASSNNECRIAALVPLVEESYGIYRFMTSMLRAMHIRVEAHDALAPLRERYRQQYGMLQKFYFECSNLRYLTSLITVPTLPPLPPDLTDERDRNRPEPEPPREKTPPPEDLWGSVSSYTPEPTWQVQQAQQAQQAHLASTTMTSNQMVLHQSVEQNSAERELMALRQQNAYAQQQLMDMNGRMEMMQATIMDRERLIQHYGNQHALMENTDRERDNQIRALEEQVAHWKSKYEHIAKMYAQLRQEHLELLQRYKDLQAKATSFQSAAQERDSLKSALQEKTTAFNSIVQECTRIQGEYDRFKTNSVEEATGLRREIAESHLRLEQISVSKGSETQALVARFNAAQQESSQRMESAYQEIESLKAKLSENDAAFQRLQAELDAKNDEISVLQAGMDQSLLALQEIQARSSSNQAEILGKIDSLNLEHRSHMDKIMDSVLDDCHGKIKDAQFDLENSGSQGSSTATPELVLSLVERAHAASSDFTTAFTKHLTDDDTTGTRQADAIRQANNLTNAITALLSNGKGILSLVEGTNETPDHLLGLLRTSAERGSEFYRGLQSTQLSKVEMSQRPRRVQEHNGSFQGALQPLISCVETFAKSVPNDGRDMVDMVEDELTMASKTIQEAAALLAALLAGNQSHDPKLTQVDLQVHRSILMSAQAITDAIARLIIAATQSQQEIVASGKGSGTKTAFYKKNSRWVDGLISAAKSVAIATKMLVESANGVVSGTHSMEQLVVAANEVAASTAQLVAASRVKAIRGSKTQDKLEAAAKAVSDATKLLVQAADHARAHRDKASGGRDDVDYSKLSPHDFKKKEMEQQVRILTLEKNLIDARKKLADMRRQGYHKEADYVVSMEASRSGESKTS